MKTFRRADLPRYTRWEEDKTAPGQWDGISGQVVGVWASQAAARASIEGRRLNYGLGFFADSDSIRTRFIAGGLIEMDFTARGLFAEKFRRQEFSEVNQYSDADVKINAPGYNFPGTTWKRAEISIPTPVIEVLACTNVAPNFTAAGLPISGAPFWLAKTGGLPTGPANPWSPGTSGDYTVHYPSGWVLQIQPGDSIGRSTGLSTFERLHMTTYRAVWRHKISP